MYKTIKRNPLGIRKLDVQAIRRERHKELTGMAQERFEAWFKPGHYGQPMEMNEKNVTRLIEVALLDGWERGVTDGAKATRDRVAESLANGKLVKPDA